MTSYETTRRGLLSLLPSFAGSVMAVMGGKIPGEDAPRTIVVEKRVEVVKEVVKEVWTDPTPPWWAAAEPWGEALHGEALKAILPEGVGFMNRPGFLPDEDPANAQKCYGLGHVKVGRTDGAREALRLIRERSAKDHVYVYYLREHIGGGRNWEQRCPGLWNVSGYIYRRG